jgi:hypothetical protein
MSWLPHYYIIQKRRIQSKPSLIGIARMNNHQLGTSFLVHALQRENNAKKRVHLNYVMWWLNMTILQDSLYIFLCLEFFNHLSCDYWSLGLTCCKNWSFVVLLDRSWVSSGHIARCKGMASTSRHFSTAAIHPGFSDR